MDPGAFLLGNPEHLHASSVEICSRCANHQKCELKWTYLIPDTSAIKRRGFALNKQKKICIHMQSWTYIICLDAVLTAGRNKIEKKINASL